MKEFRFVVPGFILLIFLSACNGLPGRDEAVVMYNPSELERRNWSEVFVDYRKPMPELEIRMIKLGLVDVGQLSDQINVDLKYASEDNFLGQDVYMGLKRAYLQPEVAMMLVKASEYLSELRPGYSIVVFDAARPVEVQQKMWDMVDAPLKEKVKFLSNPRNGSLHNFGAAVDVGIVDEMGEEIDMGATFDYMGELAWPVKEKELLEKGLLQPEHIKNRQLLRKVMYKAGFFNIQTEWWHFNAMRREVARAKYQIIP